MIFSRFLDFFHAVLVYQLVRRFGSRRAAQISDTTTLTAEAEETVDAMLPPDLPEEAGDIGALSDIIRSGLQQAGSGQDTPQAQIKISKRRRYKAMWSSFKEQHGKGAIVVVGDLAVSCRRKGLTCNSWGCGLHSQDMHERVAKCVAPFRPSVIIDVAPLSTFLWIDKPASCRFLLVICLSAVFSHVLPTPVLIKLAQIGVGLLVFLVIPIAARQPQYEPLSCVWAAKQ